jgi:hypothetical protein
VICHKFNQSKGIAISHLEVIRELFRARTHQHGIDHVIDEPLQRRLIHFMKPGCKKHRTSTFRMPRPRLRPSFAIRSRSGCAMLKFD